jgi:hypothetical protein
MPLFECPLTEIQENCYPRRYPEANWPEIFYPKWLILLVTPAGFEPATLRLGI